MVEFALLAPVLVLCICGIIDFGNIFLQWNLANEASREAARYAATIKPNSSSPLIGPNQTAVQTHINTIYPSPPFPPLTLTLNPNPPTSTNPETTVTAVVTNSVTIMTPIISAFFPSNPVTVTGTTTMLVE
jgi:Flp pilus assembly protein TadG